MTSEPFVSTVTVETAPVQALAALFDDGLPTPGPGDALPPLWHWVALPTWPEASATGRDGHPRTGGFLPDVGKPRRMFAGGAVRWHSDLVVGTDIRREDSIVSVVEKSGRQGDFVLVEVQTLLYAADGQLAVEEVQNLIYRDAPTVDAAAPVAATTPADVVPALLSSRGDDHWSFSTDPTKLMRFSSATSNGHRIHYDFPYATRVEGYPGLVVHGPLMSLALAEVARLRPETPAPTSVRHRNLRPLFCGEMAVILPTANDDGTLDLVLARAEAPDDACTTLTLAF